MDCCTLHRGVAKGASVSLWGEYWGSWVHIGDYESVWEAYEGIWGLIYLVLGVLRELESIERVWVYWENWGVLRVYGEF